MANPVASTTVTSDVTLPIMGGVGGASWEYQPGGRGESVCVCVFGVGVGVLSQVHGHSSLRAGACLCLRGRTVCAQHQPQALSGFYSVRITV